MQNIVQGEIVIIESPFKGRTPEEEIKNIEYARKAMRDSLYRGEAPFASHLLYPQMLDDTNEHERRMGIEAGLKIGQLADRTVVYTDRGISPGMKQKALNGLRTRGVRLSIARCTVVIIAKMIRTRFSGLWISAS